MFTLVLMGLSTFAIGCLPTYATVGCARHPILLVLCRLLQGFSAAGEQAGASSLTLEHSPDHQRALLHVVDADRHPGRPDPGLAGVDPVRVAAGRRRATPGAGGCRSGSAPSSSWSPTSSAAGCTRRPSFDEAKAAGTIARMPLVPLLRDHWRDVLRVIFCAFIAAVSTVFGNLGHRLRQEGRTATPTSRCGWSSSPTSCALFTQPLFGKLADRIGRKPVFIYGALSSAVLMPFYMLSMSSGNDRADLRAGDRHLLLRVRRRQRRLAVVLRRDVQHPGAILRPGDRHPARLPDRRASRRRSSPRSVASARVAGS